MRLIDKLILKELIGPFLNGLFMFVILVFTAASLFKATDYLVQGVPLDLVLKFILYSLPSVITQTFPMAMLLAGLLTFGQLSATHEIVALFAAGSNFLRASRMVFITGVLVSIVAFYWNDLVVPAASTAMWDVNKQALQYLGKTEKSLSYAIESKDKSGIEEYVIIDGGYNAKNQTLRHVSITKYSRDPKRAGQPEVFAYCDLAIFDRSKGHWVYQNGYFVVYSPDKVTGKLENVAPVDFEELEALPHGASVGKTFDEMLNTEVTDPNRKNFRDLQKEIRSDRQKGRSDEARGKEVDLYGKIALPLASMIFGMLGAALGLNTQRGASKAVGFGLAIFIVFLYWVFYHSMFVVGKNGGLPPMLASFLADIVGAVIALVLAIRASR